MRPGISGPSLVETRERGRGWLNIFSQSRVILFPTSSTGERQLYQCYQSVSPLCLERKLKLTGPGFSGSLKAVLDFIVQFASHTGSDFFQTDVIFAKKPFYVIFVFVHVRVHMAHMWRTGEMWHELVPFFSHVGPTPSLCFSFSFFFFGVVK